MVSKAITLLKKHPLLASLQVYKDNHSPLDIMLYFSLHQLKRTFFFQLRGDNAKKQEDSVSGNANKANFDLRELINVIPVCSSSKPHLD